MGPVVGRDRLGCVCVCMCMCVCWVSEGGEWRGQLVCACVCVCDGCDE